MLNKKFKQNKKGFSLAELMIVVVVIGILVGILTTIMNKKDPDEDKLKYRKAVNLTERVVYEMVNNRAYYYEGKLSDDYEVNLAYGGTASGTTKFCDIFQYLLTGTSNNTCPATFTTDDGIEWYIPSADPSAATELYVEVKFEEDAVDYYKIGVKPNGRIVIDPDWPEASFMEEY